MKRKTLSALVFLTVVCLLQASTLNAQDGKFRRSANAIPNSYIVVLNTKSPEFKDNLLNAVRDGLVAETVRALIGTYGGRAKHIYTSALQGYAVELSPGQALKLSQDSRVRYVEEDFVVRKNGTQNSPPWGLDRIDQRNLPLNSIYTYGTDGTGVHAYVLDSGIRATHTEFAGRVGNGADFVNDGQNGNDCDGHGTHVAGTIGGTTSGVAKNVTLHAVRVLGCDGSGSGSAILAGINWIAANRIFPAVVNMSLGGGYSSSENTSISNVIAQGVPFVVAAGNDSNDACDRSPSSVPDALTVGNSTSSDYRSGSSNYGTCLDLFAPGTSIRSAYNTSDTSFATASGTSMASPHVAGVIARFLQTNPNLSPAEISNSVVNSATTGVLNDIGVGSPNRLLFADVVYNNTPLPAPVPGPEPAVRIPETGVSTPYPAIYTISTGQTVIGSNAGDIIVNINGFSHSASGDVSMVLEGPGGQKILLQSGAGLNEEVNKVSYTITDSGFTMPDGNNQIGLTSNSLYKPTAYRLPNFPPPGPNTSYNNPGPYSNGTATLASTFGGTNPNGVWKLYVKDDFNGDRGRIDNWSVTLRPLAPPSAPVNLRTTSATDTQVTVAWDPNPASENVVSYKIRINYGDWITGITNPTYTFTGLAPGRQHNIELAAVNSSGATSGSNYLNAVTTGIFTPDIVNLTLASSTPNTVGLNWTYPTSNGLGAYVNIRVNQTVILVNVLPTSYYGTISYVVSLPAYYIQPNTTYSFEVQSVSIDGVKSAWSNVITVTTPNGTPILPPAQPQPGQYTLSASPNLVLPGAIVNVKWTSVNPVSSQSTDSIKLYMVGSPRELTSMPPTRGATSGSFDIQMPSYIGDYEFRYLVNGDASLVGATSNVIRVTKTPNTTPAPTSTPTPTPNPSGAAKFVANDSSTQGNWTGVYGSQGSMIANYADNLPSWAKVSVTNQGNWTWGASTSDVRALKKPDNLNDRIASTWYTASEYQIKVEFTDGQTHRVGLYSLDWDALGRTQQIELVDAQTGAVLDTKSISNFQNGVYSIWEISGQVIIKVKNTSGTLNATVSGLFIDGNSTSPTPTPTPTPTPSPTPVATPTPTASGAARFVANDTSTQGNWTGAYGLQGSIIANYADNLPSWAQVSFANDAKWTWANSTTDSRALKKPDNPNDRIASTWYSGSEYQITVGFTDGQTHRVGLYSLDWDNSGRTQQIEIVDAQTGAVLDTKNISNFQNGVYSIWEISGRVIVKVRNTSPTQNAVVSGIFIDSLGAGPPPTGTAKFVANDTSTQGNWTGVYGSQGSMIASYATNLPSWAKVSLSGQENWTWGASTSDVRALKKPDNLNDRIASTWYTASEYQITVGFTDGQTHRVGLYSLDWDNSGRTQQIEIVDAQTGAVLDTKNISNFQNGVYSIWEISGQVVIKVRNGSPSSQNAVVSGIFIDSVGATPTPSPTPIMTPTPTPPPSTVGSARFVASDSTVQGNWTGAYGSQGSIIANYAGNLPSWAQVSITGQGDWTWETTTQDSRALKKPDNPNDRIASTWYTGSEYQISVGFTDSQIHRLALYSLDWDALGRSQQIEIVDAQTGTVLDVKNISNFQNGVYSVWEIGGQVIIKVRNGSAQSQNAVISGIFIDGVGSSTQPTPTPVPSPSGAARFVATDSATQGNWMGILGSQGSMIAGYADNLPSWAKVFITNQENWTWANSTADSRALKKPDNPNDRIASTWYTASEYQIKVEFTDGQTHRVGLYSLDWDNSGRTQQIEIVDAQTGAVLDTKNISNFQNGVYSIWEISGQVVIKVRNASPSSQNAVVSGIFID